MLGRRCKRESYVLRFGGLSSECHNQTPLEVPEVAEWQRVASSGPLSDISDGVSTEFDSLLSERNLILSQFFRPSSKFPEVYHSLKFTNLPVIARFRNEQCHLLGFFICITSRFYSMYSHFPYPYHLPTNGPELPKRHALNDLDKLSDTLYEDRKLLVCEMRNGIFKSGILSGYPKVDEPYSLHE